jgi:hypothetical protein
VALGRQISPNKSKLKIFLGVLNVLVVLGLAGSTFFFMNKYNDAKQQSAQSTEEKNKELVAKVANLYDLPKDEEPTVILVKDAQNLKTDFEKQIGEIFKNLENNDYILIYKKAKLGVHYRESTNKIIATTPVSIPIVTQVVSSADEASTATVDRLKQLFGNQLTIANKVDKNLEIEKTIVVDVSGSYEEEAKSIAAQLKAEVATSLPSDVRADEGVEIVVLVAPIVSTSPADTTQ